MPEKNVKQAAVKIYLFAGMFFILLAFTAFAETIVFKSGEVLDAEVVNIGKDEIKIKIMGAVTSHPLDTIESIDGKRLEAPSHKSNQETAGAEIPASRLPPKKSKAEKIEILLRQEREKLKQLKKKYIEAKKNLKRAARTGFFGFGRTTQEVQALIRAKEKAIDVRKEYVDTKRDASHLRRRLNLARKETASESGPAGTGVTSAGKDTRTSGKDLSQAVKYFKVAAIFQSLGQTAEAEDNYEKALSIKPDLGRYFLKQAKIKYSLGEKEEAAALFENAKNIFAFLKDYDKVLITQQYLGKIKGK